MYIFPSLFFEGCLLQTILKMGQAAAPAGVARNPALGRLRGSARAALGPLCKELAGLGQGRQCPTSQEARPGADAEPKVPLEKPRWSAERRSRPASSAGDPGIGPTARRVTGAAFPHQRLSALCPPRFRGANWDTGVPRAAKNRGG